MVTMATKGPIVTVNHGRATRGRGAHSNAGGLPPVRLTRRGRMVVTGVSALLDRRAVRSGSRPRRRRRGRPGSGVAGPVRSPR